MDNTIQKPAGRTLKGFGSIKPAEHMLVATFCISHGLHVCYPDPENNLLGL